MTELIDNLTAKIKEIITIKPSNRTDDDKTNLKEFREERKRLKWNMYISNYAKKRRTNFKRLNTAVNKSMSKFDKDKETILKLRNDKKELLNRIEALEKDIEIYKIKLVKLTEKLIT